jgi:hypothetical protein
MEPLKFNKFMQSVKHIDLHERRKTKPPAFQPSTTSLQSLNSSILALKYGGLVRTNNNKRVQGRSKLVRNNTSSIPNKVLSIPTDEMLMFHKTMYSSLQFAMPDYGKA